MKSKILVKLLFVCIYSIILIFLTNCNNLTELKENQKLIIEDGVFSKVESSSSNEIKYAIEFTYYVIGEECNWGGYSIEMDSIGIEVNVYKMTTLKPDEKHVIIDTFKVNHELKANPIVKMQGYRIDSSESYEELYVEYVLKPKL